MPKIVHVVGARPNFMKIAPVMKAIGRAGFADQVLVHTGQHYDFAMSGVFFEELGLPPPDRHLDVGSGSHAEQTAKVLVGFEEVCLRELPDLVVVAGDVNSTLAAAIDAAKLHVPCAHVEAGLRSFDPRMPEEVNRIVTDRLCEILLTPSPDADENLRREGVPAERIHRVGNVMIDTLLEQLPRARATGVLARLGLSPGRYAVLTLHRPGNVDDPEVLRGLLRAIDAIQARLPVVFPVHPRTRKCLAALGVDDVRAWKPGVLACEPLGYLDFLGLTSQAALVLTDSGGLQEETTALGVPCLTLRETTERPITTTEGTNVVVGVHPDRIVAEAWRALERPAGAARAPALWDGHAGERVAGVLRDWLGRRGAAASVRGERAPPPRISFVVPTLNQAPFLRRCLDGCLAQGGASSEIVVVDGLSTDGTQDILASYGDRIRWTSARDTGQGQAVNRGVALARGEIIAWINSDDCYEGTDAIAAVVAAFDEDPALELVYGDAMVVDAEGAPIRMYRNRTFERAEDLLVSPIGPPQPATFFRRSLFQRVGGLREDLHWALDYDLMLRLFAGARRTRRLPRTLARMTFHAGAKSIRGMRAQIEEVARLKRAHARSLRIDPSQWIRLGWGLAGLYAYWAVVRLGLRRAA